MSHTMYSIIKYHLKIAVRFLLRHKQFTFINTLGLSLGLTLSLLALIFVTDELSFDKFHSNVDRIYRVNKWVTLENGTRIKNAETSGLMGKTLMETSPEIKTYTRYSPLYQKTILKNGEQYAVLEPAQIVYVDGSFFNVFDFTMVEGNPNTALQNPQSIVITQEVAHSLFDDDPVGKLLEFNDIEYQVTGVIKKPPRNSHIQFSALISWSTTEPDVGAQGRAWMNNFRTQGICTYLLLNQKPGSSLDKSLKEFVKTHIPDKAESYSFYLQPLSELYLHSSDVGGLRISRVGNIRILYFISLSSIILLVIACINYINITVSRSITRTKEVGIKKANGASQSIIFRQFLFETIVLTIFSLFLSLIFVFIFLPKFNELFDRTMSMNLLFNGEIITGMITLILLISLAGGIYPALIMSSQKPALVLKNKNPTIGGIKLRDALLTVQLIISLVMISTSFLIQQQMNYVLSQDVGFKTENLLIVPLSASLRSNPNAFLNNVRALNEISSASASWTALGGGSGTNGVTSADKIPVKIEARMYYIDSAFAKTYDLQIVSGTFFNKDLTAQNNKVLVNESLMKAFNWSHPIGKQIKYIESTLEVIGVVKDFHFQSIHAETDPAIIFLDPSQPEFAAFRFNGDPNKILAAIQIAWKKYEPFEPMDYYFADKYIERLYQSDNQILQSNIFLAFLTIGLSLMGLLGVFSVIMTNKGKEIGIRKILGINFMELVNLYARKYVLLILLSQALATPLVVYIIMQWLSNFRIHTDIDFRIFFVSLCIVLVAALLIMISQIIHVSHRSARELLRDE